MGFKDFSSGFRLLAPKAGGTELDPWPGNLRSHMPHGVAKRIFKGIEISLSSPGLCGSLVPVLGTHPVGANVFTRRGRDTWPLLCCAEEGGGGEPAGLDSSVAPGCSRSGDGGVAWC